MTIDPLRSGAPGGAWSEKKTNFSSGQPIVGCPPRTEFATECQSGRRSCSTDA